MYDFLENRPRAPHLSPIQNGFVDWGDGKNGSKFSGSLSVKEISCASITFSGTYVQAYNAPVTTIIASGINCVQSNNTAGSCDVRLNAFAR